MDPYAPEKILEVCVSGGANLPEELSVALEALDPAWTRDRVVALLRELGRDAALCPESIVAVLERIEPEPVLHALAEQLSNQALLTAHRASCWDALWLHDPIAAHARFLALPEGCRTEILQRKIASTMWTPSSVTDLPRYLASISPGDRREHLDAFERARRLARFPALVVYEAVLREPALDDLHALLLSWIDVPAGGSGALRLEHLARECDDPTLAAALRKRCGAATRPVNLPGARTEAWVSEYDGPLSEFELRVAMQTADGRMAAATVRVAPYRVDGGFLPARIGGPFEPAGARTGPAPIAVAPSEAAIIARATLGPKMATCRDPGTLAAAFFMDRFLDPTVKLRRDGTFDGLLRAAASGVLIDSDAGADPLTGSVSMLLWEAGLRVPGWEPALASDRVARLRLRDHLRPPAGRAPCGRDLAALDLAATMRSFFDTCEAVGEPLTELDSAAVDRAVAEAGRAVAAVLTEQHDISVEGLVDLLYATLAPIPGFDNPRPASAMMAAAALTFAARTCAQCRVRCLDAPDSPVEAFYNSDEHPALWRPTTRH